MHVTAKHRHPDCHRRRLRQHGHLHQSDRRCLHHRRHQWRHQWQHHRRRDCRDLHHRREPGRQCRLQPSPPSGPEFRGRALLPGVPAESRGMADDPALMAKEPGVPPRVTRGRDAPAPVRAHGASARPQGLQRRAPKWRNRLRRSARRGLQSKHSARPYSISPSRRTSPTGSGSTAESRCPMLRAADARRAIRHPVGD